MRLSCLLQERTQNIVRDFVLRANHCRHCRAFLRLLLLQSLRFVLRRTNPSNQHQSPRSSRARSGSPSIPTSSSRELLLFLTLSHIIDCSSACATADLHPRTSLSVLDGFDRRCRYSSCIHHCHASPNANDRIHPQSTLHCLYEVR